MNVNEQSAADRLWQNGTKVTFAKARWKHPCTGKWKGPEPVFIWG